MGIEHQHANDPGRALWNPAVETLSRDAMHALQLERLKKQVAYNFERSSYYRERMTAAGITPSDIRSTDDFCHVPVMDKHEHRRVQQESLDRHGWAGALLACAPREQIVRINATSGTTGIPTLYTLTAHDCAVVSEMHARKYWRAGIRPGHVMLQALSLSMFTGGLPLSQGIMHLGACVVPVGIEGGRKRVVEFAKLTRADALIATPSFATQLVQEGDDGKPARELGLRWFFSAGEPGGSEPATRKLIGEGLGAQVFDHTGGGHAFHAITCEVEDAGMHFVSDDHCLLELVDPQTRAPVAMADGAVGEMVFTFLDWRGGPLMRYALGDVLQVNTTPCACGRPGIRLRILGRADDMLIVKGVNVYPAAIHDTLLAFVPQVTGAMRIRLDAPGPRVNPPLNLRIEHGDGVGAAALEDLRKAIVQRMREALRITPAIEWLAPGTLPRDAHKSRWVEVVR
ncbi:MAG: AMP-binding protein [Burkholderiaceae bacterium]